MELLKREIRTVLDLEEVRQRKGPGAKLGIKGGLVELDDPPVALATP